MTSRFVKPANALKSGFMYVKSSFTRNPARPPKPLFISAELTNHCNLKCPECPSGSGTMTRPRGYMDIGLFHKITDELSQYLYGINLFFQGEPMMHPAFFSFLEKRGKYRLVVSTNGHFLSPDSAVRIVRSGLDKLIISLDGMDQDTYSAYRRNGDFAKVVNGIRNTALAKRKYMSNLKIEIQFLVNKKNEHQIRDIKRFSREVNASLKLKSMQILNACEIEKWLPSSPKFRRYVEKDGDFHMRNTLPDRCGRLWFNPVVTWDGKVVPCCFDKDAKYIMGDLNKDSFMDIWNSDRYHEFRKYVFTDRNSIDICRNCTSGLRGVRF